MTPERCAQGMTFDESVTFTGSAENLGREGFDARRFSLVRPRVDWSGSLRERYAKARLGDDQVAAITRPGLRGAASSGRPEHRGVRGQERAAERFG